MSKQKKPNKVDQYIAKRIKEARLDVGMTQEELGDSIGLTFQQVQKYEKGVNRLSAGRLAAISDSLGKPIMWFFPERLRSNEEKKVIRAIEIVRIMRAK